MTAAPNLRPVPDADGWAFWAAAWERSLRARNVAPLSVTTYLSGLARLTTWAVEAGIDDPADVTRDDLEAFFDHELHRTTRFGRQASPTAVAKTYRELRIFFKYLAEREGIASPMAGLASPKIVDQPVDVFSDAELQALVDACKGRTFRDRRDLAIVRMLLDTGLRAAEILGITLGDLDLAAQTVTVLGKGRRNRTVPYGVRTAETLDMYLRARSRHASRALPDLWLGGGDGSRLTGALGREGFRTLLRRRADDAGVTNVYPHRFRHTAAHAFLKAGGEEGDAMRLFGWKTRSMVDRYGAAAASSRAIAHARKLSPGDRIQ